MFDNSLQEPRRRLLLIDDDRRWCSLLADYLEPFGYAVTSVHHGNDGWHRALSENWHAIVLDMMLPGMDGKEVLQLIRRESDVPVIMLTALGDEADRIIGLEMGADDYLPKTFSPRELLARLRAVTRRPRQTSMTGKETGSVSLSSVPTLDTEEIRISDLRLRPGMRMVWQNGQELVLTPVEYDLLLSLIKARGRVKSREQLLDEIRDREFEVFDRSVDVHISALRRKLSDDPKNPRYIKTLRSVGYVFIP